MSEIVSRVYQPNPQQCCEACVFGTGDQHAPWCCPTCREPATYRTPSGTFFDSNAHYWRAPESIDLRTYHAESD